MKLRTLDTRDPGFEREFAGLVAVDSADRQIDRARGRGDR